MAILISSNKKTQIVFEPSKTTAPDVVNTRKLIEKEIREDNMVEITREHPLEVGFTIPLLEEYWIMTSGRGSLVPSSFLIGDNLLSHPRLKPELYISTSDIIKLFNLFIDLTLPLIRATHGRYIEVAKRIDSEYRAEVTIDCSSYGRRCMATIYIKRGTGSSKLLCAYADLKFIRGFSNSYVIPSIELTQRSRANDKPYGLEIDRDLITKTRAKQYTVYLLRLNIFNPNILTLIDQFGPTKRPLYAPDVPAHTTVIEENTSPTVSTYWPIHVLSGGKETSNYRYYTGLDKVSSILAYSSESAKAEHTGTYVYIPGLDDEVDFLIDLEELHELASTLKLGETKTINDLMDAHLSADDTKRRLTTYTRNGQKHTILEYQELINPPTDANINYQVTLSPRYPFSISTVIDISSSLSTKIIAYIMLNIDRETWSNTIKRKYLEIINQYL